MNHNVKVILLSLFMTTFLYSNISNAASDSDTKLKNNSGKPSILKEVNKEKDVEHKNPRKKEKDEHEYEHKHPVSPS